MDDYSRLETWIGTSHALHPNTRETHWRDDVFWLVCCSWKFVKKKLNTKNITDLEVVGMSKYVT